LSKPLLILGAGGHASVLVDILRQQNREIVGLVSPEVELKNKMFNGIEHFGSDDDVLKFDNKVINLVNGIGSLPGNNLRTKLYNKFKALGYEFETVVASNAIVSDYAKFEEGVQIFTGVIVQTNVRIGRNTIINTGAIIEHDCNIGANNHIAPGVTLSGQVQSQENVHFGTGATVIQSVFIGQNVVIGAGSSVTKNVEENTICFPARITKKVLKKNEP